MDTFVAIIGIVCVVCVIGFMCQIARETGSPLVGVFVGAYLGITGTIIAFVGMQPVFCA